MRRVNIEKFYDPEPYHQRSLDLLEGMDKGDADAWFHHPCTQSLMAALEGDLAVCVQTFMGGGYLSEESVASSAQRHAKAQGKAETVYDVLEQIREIRALSLKGEENDKS